MQVVVNDLLVQYQQAGKGPKKVLFLHGWGDSSKTFAGLIKNFDKNYNCIVLDLPGFGGSQMPSTAWGLDEYANFVKDFLKKINAQPFAVVAHSNGAALAIKAVATEVIAPNKMVLLGAAGIRNQEKFKKLLLKTVAKTGKVATFWLPKSSKKKLQQKLYGTVGSDLLVVPHMQETFKKTVRQDVQQDARKIDLPVLLIYGGRDTATPPFYGQIYANLIKNARLDIVAGAGHFVHQDAEADVAKKIEDFLK